MKSEPKKKKWKVKFSEEVMNKLDDMPDDVYEEFSKIVKGFQTANLDPKKIGQPVDWIELKTKLICPDCKSHNVEWLLDKNSDEVTFNCLKCNESFWMTHKEYKKTIANNPDKIIKPAS